MAASIAGTWIQVKSLSADRGRIIDPARTGFLAIGPQQVVIALTGLMHVVSAPVESTIDDSTHSGRILLANGLRLYVSSGEAMVEQTSGDDTYLQPMTYLDLACSGLPRTVNPGGTVQETVRVWSDRTLSFPLVHVGARHDHAEITNAVAEGHGTAGGVSADLVAAPPALATSTDTLVAQTAALELTELQASVRTLIQARAAGASRGTLEGIADDACENVQRDLLARLQVAYASPDASDTAAAITEVARRQHALAAFATVVANWLARS